MKRTNARTKVSHPFTAIKKGFQGLVGYHYHPTKGWRKDSTFRPLSAKELTDMKSTREGIA